jgi:hypothetical protein
MVMYAEMPSGTAIPDGFIVPCKPTGRTSGGWVHVNLMFSGFVLPQWVRKEQLLQDNEVEAT